MKLKVKKITKKQPIKITLLSIVIIIFISAIYMINQNNQDYQSSSAGKYVKAVVLEVKDDKLETSDKSGLQLGSQEVSLKITEGEHKGEVHDVTNEVSQLHNIVVKKGTKIIVTILENTHNSYNVAIYNYDRTNTILVSIILFVALLCLIGGIKGFKAVLGLAFAIIGIVMILIPLVARGYDAILVSIGVVSIIALVCFVVFDGISTKSVSAIIATVIGVTVAGVFAYLVQVLGHLSGFNMTEAESLMLISGDNQFYIRGLLVAGIIISSLGAVMDVAMSIASSVNEIYVVNSNLTFKQLVASGMNVGKDAMGTMANTLILAFTGSSLNLLLLVFSYGISFTQFINNDSIAIELLQGIAGSIGIVICVPVAAIITSFICKRDLKKK